MEAYLMSLRVDVWSSVLVDYNVLYVPRGDAYGKILYGNNAKAKNSILSGFIKSELVKVMHYKSTKEVWVKLNRSHEGDDKVKKAKLQTFQMRFEILKMSEEERIA